MSDTGREIAEMFTRIESGPCMIEGALLKNVYMMLGMHGRAATVEVGIRMVDEGTLREIARLMAQAGLAEALEESGPRLVSGNLWRNLVLQAFSPVFVPYVPAAVHFDGVARLSNVALNAADSPYYGFSFWVKYTGPTTGSNITFAHDAAKLRPAGAFTQANPGEFFSFWSSASGASSLEVHSAAGALTQGVWHHVIGAINTNFGAGAKLAKVYVDGALSTVISSDLGVAFVNAVFGKEVYVGGTPGGDKQIADFADVRLAPGQNWLVNGDIPATTIALFRDAAGKPVNPAIATADLGIPAVLFTGNVAGFSVNRGYGGPFTLTGTLTGAATTPLDAAPTNLVPPLVSGTLTFEVEAPPGVLTCDPGTWANDPTSYAFAWQKDGVAIGVVTPTYTVVGADRGHTMSCIVTATNTVGAGVPKASNGVVVP